MEIKNAKRISATKINCEINHPRYGWIPCTADEDDRSTLELYARIINGEAGEVVDNQPTDSELLTKAQNRAESVIDSAATTARLKYISPNKDSTYQLKREELERWIADGRPENPESGLYPYIENEAIAIEETFKTTAESVEQASGLWKSLDPLLEATARGGKVKIKKASTVEDVDIVLQATLTELNKF